MTLFILSVAALCIASLALVEAIHHAISQWWEAETAENQDKRP